MLLLGHMGITLAAAQVIDYVRLHRRCQSSTVQHNRLYEDNEADKPDSSPRIDIRWLLLGSMLPDIIDKPMGYIFLRNSLDNGRIYCHTFLFIIILTLAAFFLWKQKGKGWIFPIVFGVVMHLVLDEMWLGYKTLMWPLYGWTFPKVHYDSYLKEIFENLLLDPKLIISEIAGGLVLLWYALLIFRRNMLSNFLRTGHL